MIVTSGEPAVAPAAPRRRQADRAAAMRARLLAATVACLAEHGYAAFSTNQVVRRAEVTRGALFHHFPTRAGLIAEAMWWHDKEGWIEERTELLAAIAAGAPLVEQLRIAWRHKQRRAATEIEFRTARRADRALAQAWEEARARNEQVEPRYNTTPVAWATAPGDPTPDLTRFIVGYFLTGMQVVTPGTTPALPEQALVKFAAMLETALAAMAAPATDRDD